MVGWGWKADPSEKGLGKPIDKELKRLYSLMDGYPQLSARDQEKNYPIERAREPPENHQRGEKRSALPSSDSSGKRPRLQ